MSQLDMHVPLSASGDDLDTWRAYWKSQGHPWRTEPEIPLHRRQLLKARRCIKPNKYAHSYPFSGIRLTRADVEWLLATHEQGKGPVDFRAKGWCSRQGLDVRGADLRKVDLQGLPLSRLIGGYGDDVTPPGVCRIEEDAYIKGAAVHLEGANLTNAELAGSCLVGAHLEKARLGQAALYCADLRSAFLSGAILIGAHLEHSRLCYTALPGVMLSFAHLEGACLTAVRGEGVDLSSARLVGATMVQCHLMGCLFYKAHMEGVNLCETTVSGVGKLFEECHLEGALLRDLSLIGCTLDGAYLSGGVVEGLRTTHPQVFRGAHVEEKELGEADLWAIRIWIPCFPSHLSAVNPAGSDARGKVAPPAEEILGVPITTRPASEYYAEEAVNRGKEELARGHYWMAQRSFQEALRSDTDDPFHVRWLLALSFLYEGSLVQATDALERDLLANERMNSVSLALYLWCQACQCATRADFLERERTWLPSESGRDPLDSLEERGTFLAFQAEAGLYQIILQFIRGRYQQILEGIEGLGKVWPETYPWLLTFWQSLSLAFLEEDERALSTLQRSIEEGMPHFLLLPFRWLKEKQHRPHFFDEFIRPLFVQYRLPYRDNWGQKERKKSEKAAVKPT